ncbi:oligopeptide transport ATP-binding protein OppF [mine drainage metagenome]|uniref:Oligopeptide transport ATP-binding protein OppF n=1 Tax=mine drainage metagenome TaxID=410659 RepID=A0A1J5SY45_9ZZZZ
MAAPILEVRNLSTRFVKRPGLFSRGPAAVVHAVDDVSFALAPGEVLGLVGESGSGKSTLARTILRLTPAHQGSVMLEGHDFLALDGAALASARGRIQMVFQDPYASLNPRMTIFDALAEPLLVHRKCAASEVPQRVARLIERVGLSTAHLRKYPHEFSGGQRQRIAIARALSLDPRVLIADEPVSALDVSIQAQIINLLATLVRELGLSLVFISHDLSVIKHLSDRVAVMYLGRIVEQGEAGRVIGSPVHPYTRALVSAIPVPDPDAVGRSRIILPGEPPSPYAPPPGCPFHPRCPYAIDACRAIRPALESIAGAHDVACLRSRELEPFSP